MKYAEYVQKVSYLPHTIDEIRQILDNKKSIKKWAYLVHDKDTLEDGTPKDPHLHIMMSLNSDNTPDTISKWFDDKPERIQKNKHQIKAYENMCLYLTHEIPNEDGKYVYPRSDVVANFDFDAFLNGALEEIEERKKQKNKIPLQDVLQMICNNKIPRIKIDNYITDIDQIKYAKNIKEAYIIRDRRVAKEINRSMQVMYLYGEAGTGKTTWAKYLGKSQNYDVFVSGSSNDPLEGYQGQECVILDDLRPSDWKINDLLKLLDNHTNSMVKSRYSNKLMNDCKLIIITTVLDIEDMYRQLQDRDNEPIEQLKRRCTVKVRFTPDTMYTYQYNDATKQYEHKATLPNLTQTLHYVANNGDKIISDMQKLVDRIQDTIEKERQLELQMKDMPF